MEAVMAARRSAPPVIIDPVKDIMELMKPSTMIRTAGGPGCGNGHEILFQVRSCNFSHSSAGGSFSSREAKHHGPISLTINVA